MIGQKMIRVLVVDDSPTVRALLMVAISKDPSIEVVGEATNGLEAIKMAKLLRPDVITMDVNMPVLDGLRATEEIMADAPARILMVCSADKENEVDLSFRSIQAGALELIPKRDSGEGATAEWGDRVVEAIRLMSEIAVIRRHRSRPRVDLESVPLRPPNLMAIGIAASVGGPAVLAYLLAALPEDYPLPILVAQHIVAGFSRGLAKWLGTQVMLPVEIAEAGMPIRPGHVYLAPDGQHIEVGSVGVLKTVLSTVGHCPSGDRLFSSLARRYGPTAIGLILTGMGEDGAEGLLELHRSGAMTFGQDEPSCAVFGMPLAALQRNAVTGLLSPQAMKEFLEKLGDDAPSKTGQ